MSEADGRSGRRPGADADDADGVRAHRRPVRSGHLGRLLGATLLALVLVGVAGALGRWQLHAWHERRAAAAVDLTRLDPVPLTDLMGPDDPFPGRDVGRPVTIAGSWLPQGAFYVSGREHEGRDGLWVVVPMSVGAGSEPAIPVVIGWTASTDGVVLPSGRGAVTGWLQPPDGTGEIDADPDDDVVPQLRTADAIQRVDNDLYSAYAVATEPAPGLLRASLDALPQAGRFTALRNLLYALEWWFFGGFAGFIWWRWVRDERAERAATTTGGQTHAEPSVD